MKLEGPEKAGLPEAPAPGGVGLVGYDQVDALRFEKRPGRIDDLGGIGGRREAVDDRAQPHIAELLVARTAAY